MTMKMISDPSGGGKLTADGVDLITVTPLLPTEVNRGIYTDPALPSFNATPTFDCAVSNVFEPDVMTENITAITMDNPKAGQTVQIRFVQDATGGWTITVPTGAKIDGYLATAANAVTWLVMTYSGRASRWEGNWLQVPA